MENYKEIIESNVASNDIYILFMNWYTQYFKILLLFIYPNQYQFIIISGKISALSECACACIGV